jgi:glycosyltransferase involved in cell wall biosynthesis
MKISVAMCTYNGARFLRSQLQSLASQSRAPDELIICDDQSVDKTAELVRSWAATVPFEVRFHVNDQRLGVISNFEKAISLCTGELISLCDQDDIWLDDKLADAQRAFERHPQLGLWYTDARLISENGQPLLGTLWQRFGLNERARRSVTGPNRLARLLRRSVVTGATMAFAVRHRGLVLPIPKDCPEYIHDRWIATLIAAAAPIASSSRPSMLYRQHAGQAMGAAPIRGPVEVLKSRVRRRQDLMEDDLKAARIIQTRLTERAGDEMTAQARANLAERIRLLEMRVNLPGARLRRVIPVTRSLIAGQYNRHAEGPASAAKDLLL